MDILNLFIDYHYKSIVSTIRERHVLTLHLFTANCRRKLTTGSCCKNTPACYVILPDRVIPQFLKLWSISMHFNGTLILLYFIEMLPRTVSVPAMENPESATEMNTRLTQTQTETDARTNQIHSLYVAKPLLNSAT